MSSVLLLWSQPPFRARPSAYPLCRHPPRLRDVPSPSPCSTGAAQPPRRLSSWVSWHLGGGTFKPLWENKTSRSRLSAPVPAAAGARPGGADTWVPASPAAQEALVAEVSSSLLPGQHRSDQDNRNPKGSSPALATGVHWDPTINEC